MKLRVKLREKSYERCKILNRNKRRKSRWYEVRWEGATGAEKCGEDEQGKINVEMKI